MAHCVTGSCWNVTYEGQLVMMMVVDRVGDGHTLSKMALDTLACVDSSPCPLSKSFVDMNCSNNHAAEFGAVDGITVQVPNSLCGLKQALNRADLII